MKGYLIIIIRPLQKRSQRRADTCWKCLTDGDAEIQLRYSIYMHEIAKKINKRFCIFFKKKN